MKRYLFIFLIIGLILYAGYNLLSGNGSAVMVKTGTGPTIRLDENQDFSLDISSELLQTGRETDSADKDNSIKLNLKKIQITPDYKAVENDEQDNLNNGNRRRKKTLLIDKIRFHIVKKGENLWNIAGKYNIDIDTLIGANEINNMNRIRPGMKLQILPVKGILYKIAPGESLWTISRKFKISLDSIAEANNILNPDLVKPGKLLILPGAKPELSYKDRLDKKFIKPVQGRISSPFGKRWGRMHEGIDYAVNIGTNIHAAMAGKIIYSGWASGYGNTIVIEHQKGLRTLYGHISKLLVHSGQWVSRGQVIAKSGNTGRSTGPHLHFEIQINGRPVNPLNYLR